MEEAGTLRERSTEKSSSTASGPAASSTPKGFAWSLPADRSPHRLDATALTGLLLFLPFLPFVILAVRLSSPGPIFFRQTRVGQGGRNFTVYKFRTMRQDAEAAGAKWATKNDPRVTNIGMFMRKTRLDEVPQLWNVLRGDMGFVGPRPERPEFIPWLSEQIPFFDLRHMIRPGLTGWAQVRYGYGATLAQVAKNSNTTSTTSST